LPDSGAQPLLLRSWERSRAAGLQPEQAVRTDAHSSAADLRQTLQHNHSLLAHARPVMEFLFEQLRHSQNVVVLADHKGTLIHTLGDATFLHQAQRVALTSGASWREEHRGTNAIGTALAENQAVAIVGAEHYLNGHAFLTCAAAPIVSAQGDLLGILDVSGDQRQGHPHTLGLVNTAARLIENQLLLADCKRLLRVHLHTQPEGLGSVAEGIVVLSDAGLVVGANRAARALMQLRATEVGHCHWSSLADVQLPDLLAAHGRGAQLPLSLRQRNGHLLYARAQPGEAVLPRANHLSTAETWNPVLPLADPLSQLDSGDLQWRRAADKVRRVLNKPIPVLIEGESGVGKELFARAIHDSSQRMDGPFVAINCAAIPEHLIEAELFGYAAGAFTGARKEGSPGLLRKANGGTLFLDEIGDMPLSMQARLLRVLQERSVSPLGGGPAVAVDFALLCATHSQLRAASGLGQFRDDLFYRINGLTLRLPALRERSDFAALASRLLAEFNPGAGVRLDGDVLEKLRGYHWPGNLRQLSSVLRTASAMLAPGETVLGWQHMPDDLLEELALAAHHPPQAKTHAVAPLITTPADTRSLDQLSRQLVRQALEQSGGNVSLAARTLGISRQTLYKKLKD
jgi:transcriptional regulator of acetoin/glycerol metabolism